MINQRYLIITPEEQQVLIEGHIEDEVLMLEAYKGGFGNSLILAEDRDATKSETSGFSMLEAGLNVQYPLGLSFLNRAIDAGLFLVVSRFFNRVEFLEDGGDTERANLIYTAGLTFGTDAPVSIWQIDFDRVGIDYRWGNAGFRGIGFNLGFPF